MEEGQEIPFEQRPLPLDESQLAYDALGEVCDAWVRAGDRFVVDENGEHHRETRTRSEQLAAETFRLDYNPALVTTRYDDTGHMVHYVTPKTFDRYLPRYAQPTYTGLERLMKELPLDVLVYSPQPNLKAKYPHPSGVTPLGIRLGEIPKVREWVEGAYVGPPSGQGTYPPGALVLWSRDKRYFLKFFDAVLTPPQPEEPQAAVVPLVPKPPSALPPASHVASGAALQTPAPPASPASPAQRQPPEQTIVRPGFPPHASPPRHGRLEELRQILHEEWRPTVKAASLLLAGAGVLMAGVALEAKIEETHYSADPERAALMAAILGLLAVIAYLTGKEDK